MKDQDLTEDATLAAIRDIKGIEILINLLETKVHKCVVSIDSILINGELPHITILSDLWLSI